MRINPESGARADWPQEAAIAPPLSALFLGWRPSEQLGHLIFQRAEIERVNRRGRTGSRRGSRWGHRSGGRGRRQIGGHWRARSRGRRGSRQGGIGVGAERGSSGLGISILGGSDLGGSDLGGSTMAGSVLGGSARGTGGAGGAGERVAGGRLCRRFGSARGGEGPLHGLFQPAGERTAGRGRGRWGRRLRRRHRRLRR